MGVNYLEQAQYNAARIMRHLALDRDAAHRKAAHAAVPALVALIKVSCLLPARSRLAAACCRC
jgi:hypothetical protein